MKVLLADDDRFFRQVFTDLFSEAGHEIATASDGEEALRLLSELILDLDLLVVDIEMPKLKGTDLLQTIRTAGGEQDLPVLVISGKTELPPEMLQLLGTTEFISKSVGPDEILGRAEALVARAWSHDV